jgi:competence protein ComEC
MISVGADNRYRHPNPEVLQALQSRRTRVLRTDDDGTIVVSIDGGEALYIATGDARWTLPRKRSE